LGDWDKRNAAGQLDAVDPASQRPFSLRQWQGRNAIEHRSKVKE